jgi:cold shock protein
MLTGKTRRLNPAGLSCEECQRRSSLLTFILRESGRAERTVKWFNATKRSGFIQPDGATKDVFVHISAVERAGLSTIAEGAKVTFDIVDNRGEEAAENLRLK